MAKEKSSLTVHIDSEVKREAQIKAIREDTTLTEAVEALLDLWAQGKVELPKGEGEQGNAVAAELAVVA